MSGPSPPPMPRPPSPERLLLPIGFTVSVLAMGVWTWVDWVRYAAWTGYGLRTGLVALGATLALYGVLRLARHVVAPDDVHP